MRETCARVLAAALMTGAIATAMGLPTIFESAHDLGRALVTPPSSGHRSVRVPALTARARPPSAERLATAPQVTRPLLRPAIVRTPSRSQGKPKPAPVQQPEPGPAPESQPEPERQLTSTVSQPEPAAPVAAATPPAKDKKKEKKPKHQVAEPEEVAAPVAPEVQPVEAAPPAAEEHDHGKGHEKDKEKEKHEKRKD
jgi:hypothetical protein